VRVDEAGRDQRILVFGRDRACRKLGDKFAIGTDSSNPAVFNHHKRIFEVDQTGFGRLFKGIAAKRNGGAAQRLDGCHSKHLLQDQFHAYRAGEHMVMQIG